MHDLLMIKNQLTYEQSIALWYIKQSDKTWVVGSQIVQTIYNT